ncbi:hypothetical protein CON65_21270 [Bacillus pseudomycoides]|uniref:DUF3969 domain-containing protein n=1 Tax=Bacillus pseudomycoides TaxID=64104 RepID=A0AA91ZRK0_9BACI|nr:MULTISPECIES: DUF3969 family protein [Bacillus]PEB50976.1 hypothetical protein COO03_19510 [Bacillus sp. AFS098217]PED80710.1 hypothetical protein CON65_21270 [Bacillus pseudomycoides]PEU11912.1 hypothetical protein CN524_13950 [Bacillus sp. AFS019443]PEU12220.1 hypothetical protein CN525_20965 [Bacillus sp. AFS014408]PFW61342.1 hypothetical protein COL20_17910 [Bacillus sp. AFS075034]
MKLIFQMAKQPVLEKTILLFILSIVESLKLKVVSLDEAHRYIFNLEVLELLMDRNIDDQVLELIHSGMGLEDILHVLPEELEQSIEELKWRCIQVLGEYGMYEESQHLIEDIR